ncbi:hypothetical protein AALP_AA5G048100 [Arabis alpina]|uniref:Uncharacterized protein n=1 Tax=Arabis alpina TaxID=50452 RepID=A0A087GUZ5_ARAAL|nr:hypothetical protein AALP_AA5G048100 [Arabis alpina]
MQYYETTREKDYYEVAQGQRHEGYGQGQNHQGYGLNSQGYGQSQNHQGHGLNNPGYGLNNPGYGLNNQGYGQSQTKPVYGHSPTLNHRSHGGFLDGLFKGQNGQKSQGGLGSFLGQRKSNDEVTKSHGHGKLLGQHQKKTHETDKGMNGLGMFINNGEKKHKKKDGLKKKKNKDGNGSGSGNESSSSSDSD